MPKKSSSTLRKLSHYLFGKISWNMPPWMQHLRHKARTQPKPFWGTTLVSIICITAIFVAYYWYQSLPKPQRVIAQITPPQITPNEKKLIPNPLVIDFGMITDGQLRSQAVAPLNLVGNPVKDGVSLTPVMPGKWTWETDSQLSFHPDQDWPAGQTYTVTFAKNFFTAKTKMADYRYSFSTQPFVVLITQFKFYQDPVHPQVRQAIATLNFTYPVDANSLEKNIQLTWQTPAGKSLNFAVNYDENKRVAYIRSESLTLPTNEQYLELTLAKHIQSLSGTAETKEAEKATVLIPDAGSFLKVSQVASMIVRNQQDRPEQVLTLETTLGVTDADLKKYLHVYVLPQDYPATLAEPAKLNYHWQDPGAVTPAILALAQPLALTPIAADRDYASLHSYTYHTTTPAYLFVKLDKGLPGFGNFMLTHDFTAILPVPNYPQEISFLRKGALLALGTEEKLSVLVRGLATVKFDIARVLPDDVNHLITQTNGDFSHPAFIDPSFSQQNISEIYSQTQTFDATDPAKEQYTALDLSKYLATKNNKTGSLGLFLLQARGWDKDKNLALNVQTNRLVLITDLGLLVKDNYDGSHDVFVQSITAGTPVKAASVAILGKNGLPLLTHTSDAQGHVSFPSLVDFVDEQSPTVYLVRNNNDVSFIPYSRFDRLLNYSRFDVGGVMNYYQAPLTAYLFSDRGVYRPGDTTHIGMIIKQPFVMPQAAGLPLEVIIVDPRGTTVKDEKLILNDSGFLTLDLQTQATSATGQYLVNLYIVKDNHPSSMIGSTAFNVAEFLPDRMRITTHLSPEQTRGWIAPANLTANVNLWNLYGAPAVDRRVSAKMLLSPFTVSFKEFPDYTFVDPLINPKAPPKVFTDTLSETRTDAQGQAEFNLKLDRFEQATYQLTVFTQGFEADGGRSVSTQVSALVSPLPYFVGYKSNGDLSFIKQNGARSINIIAINPQLQRQALDNLTIQLFNQHPVTTLIKREDGSYQYQSILQTTQMTSTPFTITVNGTDYTLPTQQIGDFLVSITDKNGLELSRFKYSVVGASQQPLPKNAELNVKLNKSEFTPGEEIEMQITAPYTGAGLITIERDKVYAFKWFQTNTTTSVQKIQVPNDFQGDGYVNIAFVRDINSPEIFMSPLSYSVLPFSVTHKNHDLRIDLLTTTLARPGDFFDITYKTDKPGKMIVFAVDEGILQVTQFAAPDPLKFFFQKHALQVTTQQIVDQILPKFIAARDLSAAGGDGGEAALAKNLNPFKRKTEAPVVYWSGIIDTDTIPRQLVYQIPDYFNGLLRVMAVAVAADAVGAATTSAEVRGYFVINPNVPTFVAPDDEFEVTASIANNVAGSGAKANVTVTLQSTTALDMLGTEEQTLVIPEGQERSVHYKLRAKSLPGSADLKFIARLNDKSSTQSSTLSVRPATPYFTTLTSGYTSDATKTLPLDRALYSEYRTVQALASPSPLILVNGLQSYLNEYPYGCTEQLISKAFPLIVIANQPWFTSDAKTVAEKIQQTMQMLGQRQMSNGGFNYWPDVGTIAGNDFASVYAMHFLTEAKAQGLNVASDMYAAGISFLKELVTQDVNSLDQARLQAYAIYILTRNEIVTTNYLTHLQLTLDKHPDLHWKRDITSAYIAATYQLLKSSADAERLMSYYQPQTENPAVTTDFYNQTIGDAQYLYLLAQHFPDRLQKLKPDFIVSLVNSLNSNAMNTVLSSYTSLALAAYGHFYPKPNNPTLGITQTLDNGNVSGLTPTDGMYQNVAVDDAAKSITFNNPAKQGYFYQLLQSGFDKTLPSAAINQGIEVYREFRNEKDSLTTTAQLGEEITVHLRARALDDQYHENIAVVDLLPGGFEVVSNSTNAQNMDYTEVREDRVIFFGGLNSDSKEIIYRIKATNTGTFTVPPVFAKSMYNPLIQSLGIADHITVKDNSESR